MEDYINQFKSMNIFGNNKNQSSQGTKNAKKQKFKQTEQTAQIQQFLDTVDDVFDCVEAAASLYKDESTSNKMVDTLCDGAVLALNMFAGCCEELYKDKNKDAIDLGTKRAMDKFAELESDNPEVHALIEPHRKFMIAALEGHKDLRYKETRVKPGKAQLFENNVDDLNGAFAQIIASDQKFVDRQESFKDPEMNQKLAKQHQSQLNEYRGNKKYKNKTKNNNNSKYVRPKQSELYYTKKGKGSQFRNRKAEEEKEKEARAMDEDVYGAEQSAYDKIMDNVKYNNAVLLLSPSNALKYDNKNTIAAPIPCQMLRAADKNPEKMVLVKLCHPYNRCTIPVPGNMLQLNEKEVMKTEDEYIEKYKKLGSNYLSIKEQKGNFEVDSEGDANVDGDDGHSDSDI